MLYHLLYPLASQHILFNVVKYITFRSFMALFTSMFIVFLFGRIWIRFLAKKQFTQTLCQYVPETHQKGKKNTPTMGGVLLWIAIFVSSLLWARWDVIYTWLVLAISLLLGLVGFIDDYLKVIKRDAHGLKARFKFPLQVIVTTLVVLILFDGFHFDSHLAIPFFKQALPNLGWFYIVFGVLVIVGASNAVNLTDGLDVLEVGPSMIAFLTLVVFTYVAGHIKISEYLQIPYVPFCGELSVFCAAVVGGLIGFLWFNSYPAEIFMGDVGSLPLGGALGFVALVSKNELLLLLIGGLFVLETLSVITQVASFKLTGKRMFKMAPIHHHFELKGWPESKVTVRFWIIAIILALISLTTLKLR